MNNHLKKKNSKKTIYKSFIFAFAIVLCAFLPFIHDLVPRGIDYPGYSSLRTFLYVALENLFGLIGWSLFLWQSKGKMYRFAILVPVLMTFYQLIIYIVNLKKTSFNDVNIKLVITFVVIIIIVVIYFKQKLKKKNE